MSALAPVLQAFFTDRLFARRLSPHTIAAYRDTYRLLLRYAHNHTGVSPARLDLADLDAPLIRAFLNELENGRGNSIATRNLRLTAIHALFRYAALRCPEHAELIAHVLAIPNKRPDRPLVNYLTPAETDALLAAPDRASWQGRRDYVLLTVAVQTGLRVSELTGLTRADIVLGVGAHIRCHGKGRKQRCTPLTKPVARLLSDWLQERSHTDGGGAAEAPVFATSAGQPLSTDAVAGLLAKHRRVAIRTCPSLTGKHLTPHTLRHTCAMNLLHAGVDVASIALWLGHANIRSTDPYLHADLKLKEAALAKITPIAAARRRYQPDDELLAFLEAL